MIYDRLVEERQQRPFVKDLNPIELKEFIGKHLFERSFYYQKANYKVKVDGKNVTEICNEILEFYSK
jgi:shikimate kinase